MGLQQVIATGMDAITQLIESYISRRAAPIPQALCLQGLKYFLINLCAYLAGDNTQPGLNFLGLYK